jgi:hypothetical protein
MSDHHRFLRRLLDRWERFWFEEVPPHSYAVLRILVGVLGLIGVLGLTPVSTFWLPDGLMPLPGGGVGLRSYLSTIGLGVAAGWVLFSALAGGFAAMALGYRSGWAVTLCFFGSIVQALWNRLPLSGVHDVLVAILFCLLWAETGATLSVDSWLARRRRVPCQSPASSAGHSIWPLRLIRIQVSLIYFNTGVWKLFGEPWRDGSAIHYVLDLNTFQRVPYPLPFELEWIATVATYLTLVWEISFPFMMFHRWTRRLALATGVLMHVGMWATLELGLFSWIMMASYLAFLDPVVISRFVSVATGFMSRGKVAGPDGERAVPANVSTV